MEERGLRAYQRRTRVAEALIASAYLAAVNTRRVRRALTALFGGAVGKDIVSRLPMSLPFIKHEEIVADLVDRHEATIRLIAVARIRKYR
jgi:hypothetical protein